MKFIALACLSVLTLATINQKMIQKTVHCSLTDVPQKMKKVHNFLKPHIDETGKCIKKNAKQIAVKAKPHVQKAYQDLKAKQKESIVKIKKFHGDVKKKCNDFGKKVGNLKTIKVEVNHKYSDIQPTTQCDDVVQRATIC